MSFSGALHLAWRYLARHRLQTFLLAAALGIVLALPLSVRLLARTAGENMRARAQSTPLVLGARGSAIDLMLSALYFKRQRLDPVTMHDCQTIRDTGLAQAIPVHVRFHSQEAPIVGTELEYFSLRGAKLASGRWFGRLGDCVVGAHLATNRGIKPGDSVFSSPEQVFDLAGVYPLKMRVTGVMAESGTADDDAIFVDMKTAWLIEGKAHGHDDLTQSPAAGTILKNEGSNVVGNAAVRIYNEVTDANFSSFHFHGDPDTFDVSAVIVLPRNAKSEAILAGRYLDANQPLQLIRPKDELETLLATLFRVEKLAVLALALIGLTALVVAVIVFALSFRLRQREFATLAEIGVARTTLALVKASEVALVGLAGASIAATLVGLVAALAPRLLLWGLR